jgi:hypothetical protein
LPDKTGEGQTAGAQRAQSFGDVNSISDFLQSACMRFCHVGCRFAEAGHTSPLRACSRTTRARLIGRIGASLLETTGCRFRQIQVLGAGARASPSPTWGPHSAGTGPRPCKKRPSADSYDWKMNRFLSFAFSAAQPHGSVPPIHDAAEQSRFQDGRRELPTAVRRPKPSGFTGGLIVRVELLPAGPSVTRSRPSSSSIIVTALHTCTPAKHPAPKLQQP